MEDTEKGGKNTTPNDQTNTHKCSDYQRDNQTFDEELYAELCASDFAQEAVSGEQRYSCNAEMYLSPEEWERRQLEAKEQLRDGASNLVGDVLSTNVGMFRIKSANETILEALQRPNPNPLIPDLWYQGEIACLFADTNVGKSLFAVQVGAEIAQSERVLYFDFELSDKQFQLRYSDKESNTYHQFPENFFRAELDPESLTSDDWSEQILEDIEKSANEMGTRVIIIDNLTFLCNRGEKGDVAGEFMIKLCRLKKMYNLSILILAHTPKRLLNAPITENDLAGSKKLANFFDAIFALGRSVQGTNIRYLKQIKFRNGEFLHGADNVIVFKIEKINAYTAFREIGISAEKEHLQDASGDEEKSELIRKVSELKASGKSVREIAKELNISTGCVSKYANKTPEERSRVHAFTPVNTVNTVNTVNSVNSEQRKISFS